MLPPETTDRHVLSDSNSHGDHSRLSRKLEASVDLSDDEKEAILGLPMTVKTVGADQDLARDGERPSECCLVLEGFTCRYKLLPDGKRQIMAIHIPGDFVDLHSFIQKKMDHGVATLTPCKVA